MALLFALSTPPTEAAPYIASCNSGVLAPQICTLVASSVVAGFASPGQHLLLTPVRTVVDTDCDAGPGRVEHYRGYLRGKSGVRPVSMVLAACPDAYPTVSAGTENESGYDYRVWAQVAAPVGERPAWFSFTEGTMYGTTTSWADEELFRRHTGMSAYADGTSSVCQPGGRSSNGNCELGADEYPYSAYVDSSISGHWARLQLAVSAEAKEVEDRTVRVTSQPYGNGGWKITRVS